MGLNASNKIKFSDALELMKYELLAQEKGVVKQVPTLAGKPGIGKTESLKALGKKLGYETIVVQLSAVSPEEFSGIPEFEDAPEDFAKKYSITGVDKAKFTRWSIPELVAIVNHRAEEIKKKGDGKIKGIVVLFDDIHVADPALERYMFNLFLDKVVGQYRLADNVLVCAAMNDSDEAGFNGFNAAVLDRLAIYPVEFDFNYWYSIIGGKLDNIIAAFLRSHKERAQGDESVDKVTPSPRSWTELSNFIKFMRKNNVEINEEILRNAACARVGSETAAELIKFKITYDNFNFEKLIKEPVENIKVPDDIIEQILYADLVRYIKDINDAKKIAKLIERYEEKQTFVTGIINEASILNNFKEYKNNKGLEYLIDWFIKSDRVNLNKAFFDSIGEIID